MKRAIVSIATAMVVYGLPAVPGLGQENDFVPPSNVKKYFFYPQGGNFFSDLFPNNFVNLARAAGRNPPPGDLAYNGSDYTYGAHLGIDTEITNFTAQEIGVPIFAALDGTVKEARDGEFDKNTAHNFSTGNYVKIDHGDGHTTTYYHLKKDSVAVTVHQNVAAGQQIGLTGSSGDSTAPHLHFESAVNGNVFEPFAGSTRPGISAWVSQPEFRKDAYLRTFVITDQDLSSWLGLPYDTTRKGTFFTGTRDVYTWFQIGNGEGITNLTLNCVRPDKSVSAFRSDDIDDPARNDWRWFPLQKVNLNVTGTWHLEVKLNGKVFAEAPFTVLSPGSPVVNHAPNGVQAVFDPALPVAGEVPFCRITSPTVFLDADYDFVRYHYIWKVNGAVIRDVVSAGLADAIPHDKIHAGDKLACSITPSDGIADGPSTTVTATVKTPPQ